MEAPLITILYTQNLAGETALLPRLYTRLRRLRGGYSGRILMVDVGGACAADVWHCAVTGGRSMIVALDGMGYDAIHVESWLAEADRAKLGDNVRIAAVDAAHPALIDQIAVAAARHQHAALFTLDLRPTDETQLEGHTLRLASIHKGQVGMAQVTLGETPRLNAAAVYDLSPDTSPDPTITASVAFILSEARQAQRRLR